jgi:hypothetical protein
MKAKICTDGNHAANKALKVYLVFKDNKVYKGFKVLREFLVKQALKVLKDFKDLRVIQEKTVIVVTLIVVAKDLRTFTLLLPK